MIENGAYAIAAPRGPKVGPNQVQISGLEVTGQKIENFARPGGPKLDQFKEIVPPRYRDEQSILKYEVVSGDQEKNFELDGGRG